MATKDEIRAAAQRLSDEELMFSDFSIVYEDEELEGWTVEEWRQVHDLITHSKAVLPDDD